MDEKRKILPLDCMYSTALNPTYETFSSIKRWEKMEMKMF